LTPFTSLVMRKIRRAEGDKVTRLQWRIDREPSVLHLISAWSGSAKGTTSHRVTADELAN